VLASLSGKSIFRNLTCVEVCWSPLREIHFQKSGLSQPSNFRPESLAKKLRNRDLRP
jgi:hypothetical protein